MQRFIRRVVDVGTWAAEHPVETLAILGRETGSRTEWVSYTYGVDVHTHLYTNLDEASLAALDEFKSFLFQWGFIGNNFNISEWVDYEPMLAVERTPPRKRA